jgi:hypothetical protein
MMLEDLVKAQRLQHLGHLRRALGQRRSFRPARSAPWPVWAPGAAQDQRQPADGAETGDHLAKHGSSRGSSDAFAPTWGVARAISTGDVPIGGAMPGS